MSLEEQLAAATKAIEVLTETIKADMQLRSQIVAKIEAESGAKKSTEKPKAEKPAAEKPKAEEPKAEKPAETPKAEEPKAEKPAREITDNPEDRKPAAEDESAGPNETALKATEEVKKFFSNASTEEDRAARKAQIIKTVGLIYKALEPDLDVPSAPKDMTEKAAAALIHTMNDAKFKAKWPDMPAAEDDASFV